jgi:cell division transport system permease protein
MEILGFWIRETFSNIGRNRLMCLLAVSTVTICLFVLGAFYFAWGSLQSQIGAQTQKIDLRIILNPDVSDARRDAIFKAAHIPQVAQVTLVTKQQALKQLTADIKDFPVNDLEKNNPLGDELHISLKDPSQVFKVRNYLTSISGVQKTLAPQEDNVVKMLLQVNHFVKVAGIVALLILGLGILLIIHNAIRLTIFARRQEIRIMELVGATPWFIRIPFLMEGLIYGLAGAIIAAVLLLAVLLPITHTSTPLLQVLIPPDAGSILRTGLAWIILAGVCFGFFGSWISLSRSIGKAVQA